MRFQAAHVTAPLLRPLLLTVSVSRRPSARGKGGATAESFTAEGAEGEQWSRGHHRVNSSTGDTDPLCCCYSLENKPLGVYFISFPPQTDNNVSTELSKKKRPPGDSLHPADPSARSGCHCWRDPGRELPGRRRSEWCPVLSRPRGPSLPLFSKSLRLGIQTMPSV